MQVRADQLATALQRQGLRSIYTLHGDEPLLAQEAADLLRARARADGYADRQVFVVSGAHFDWSGVLGAAQEMIKQGGGKVVNISSRASFRGEPTAPGYGAIKAGLNAMSQSLAQALAPHNVFVYVVAPGFVDTERVAPKVHGPDGEAIRAQSPLNRVARVDEVARTVLFLASDEASYTTGTTITAPGCTMYWTLGRSSTDDTGAQP